jgi:hypothetical protein
MRMAIKVKHLKKLNEFYDVPEGGHLAISLTEEEPDVWFNGWENVYDCVVTVFGPNPKKGWMDYNTTITPEAYYQFLNGTD